MTLVLDSLAFEGEYWEENYPFGSHWTVGNEKTLSFLRELSRMILKNDSARNYPDLVTFGYFCRGSNLQRELGRSQGSGKSIGWGTVLHIAPSNIPINFAFSFVWGMLAGNSNIVRLPSKTYPQNQILLGLIEELFQEPDYSDLRLANRFVGTERDSAKLEGIVSACDVLVVWGGDETVQYFRRLAKQVHCIELYFPNRLSSVVISASYVSELSPQDLQTVTKAFYNDTYLVDQNACSSPSTVFWLGEAEETQEARGKFWKSLGRELDLRSYQLDPLARIDRILDIMRIAQDAGKALVLNEWHNDIFTLFENRVACGLIRFGTFIEIEIGTLAEIAISIRSNEQTISTLGIEGEELFQALVDGAAMVDRIVPMGSALDLGFQWDGKHMIDSLSRNVEVR